MTQLIKGIIAGFWLLLVIGMLPVMAQDGTSRQQTSHVYRMVMRVDTMEYSTDRHAIKLQNERRLAFRYNDPSAVAHVRLYTNHEVVNDIQLVPSGDYELVDSVINMNNVYYAFKVRFKDLNRSDFLNFSLRVFTKNEKKPSIQVLPLQPYTTVRASARTENEEFFIGEEKVVELLTDNPGNVRVENKWFSGKGYDYMLSEQEGRLFLHILPSAYGKHKLDVQLRTLQPDLLRGNILQYAVQFEPAEFTVKESRINFLNINMRDLTLDETNRKEGVEVQLDNHRFLQMEKTYRIENQEKPGGPLIAELFTKSRMSNGKVLCVLRLFNYHRQSDGYLYIKDGDAVRFITNFSVTPPTRIDAINVLHEGGEWTDNLQVFPGETVEVKVKGEGLHKSNLHFKGVTQQEADTLIDDEKRKFFTLQIPTTISNRNIEVFNHSENTGKRLRVKEFQEPRDFDFVTINYGKGDKTASSLNKPVLYGEVMQDVIISFKPDRIDTDDRLYGEQHLTIRFKMVTVDNRLIDQHEINNVVVCPGERSPRHTFYNRSKCTVAEINLNRYLRQKTYDMEDWSRIEIEIEHVREVHGATAKKQRVDLVYKREYEFDIDVSFPAGLLIQQQGQSGFGNFGGISMAMIAQFSFFRPNKIASYRPYKIGAGFLAFNAFNFSNNPDVIRDVGIVVMGSVYPIKSIGKLTFPLYLGGGYFLSQGRWFTLLGPGIRVNF